jgi:hypothetical protein
VSTADLARLRELEALRIDMARLIGVLVERCGGEVTVLPHELLRARNVERREVAFTGAVVLRSRPEAVPQ